MAAPVPLAFGLYVPRTTAMKSEVLLLSDVWRLLQQARVDAIAIGSERGAHVLGVKVQEYLQGDSSQLYRSA